MLEQVAVDDEVRELLLHRKGPLGTLLRIEEMIENSNFAEVDGLLVELERSVGRLEEAQHEAYAWIHGQETPGL